MLFVDYHPHGLDATSRSRDIAPAFDSPTQPKQKQTETIQSVFVCRTLRSGTNRNEAVGGFFGH